MFIFCEYFACFCVFKSKDYVLSERNLTSHAILSWLGAVFSKHNLLRNFLWKNWMVQVAELFLSFIFRPFVRACDGYTLAKHADKMTKKIFYWFSFLWSPCFYAIRTKLQPLKITSWCYRFRFLQNNHDLPKHISRIPCLPKQEVKMEYYCQVLPALYGWTWQNDNQKV